MTFKGKYTEKFSTEVLQRLIMPTKAIVFHLSQIIKQKISYSTYDNWKRGDSAFPPDLIAPLYLATGEKKILDWICNPCNYLAIPNYTITSQEGDTKIATLSIISHLGKMFNGYKEIQNDGGLKANPGKAKKILDSGIEVIRYVMGFVEKVRKEADL